MIFLTRPSPTALRRFLDHQRGLSGPDASLGAAFGAPAPGVVVDQNRVRLGTGPEVYERAVGALRRWAMFQTDWIEVWPPEPPVVAGETVAVLARGLGVWSLFACRIVRVEEEHGPVEAVGFTYGTLPGHVLSGVERFTVRWDRAEGSVWYHLDAQSRPGGVAGRLAYPLVRRVQRRYPPDSLRAMSRAVEGEGR